MSKERVVFRKDKRDGEIFALFPNSEWNNGLVTSYARVGQHGGALYSHCIRISKPATAEEYAPLREELEGIGYSLLIRQRR